MCFFLIFAELVLSQDTPSPSKTPYATAAHHPSTSIVFITCFSGFALVVMAVMILCLKKSPETERTLYNSNYMTIE